MFYLYVRYKQQNYWAWTNPMTHMLHLSSDVIAAEAFNTMDTPRFMSAYRKAFPGLECLAIAANSQQLIPMELRAKFNC